MGRTLVFAVVASSPLVLGAYLGARFTFPERLLAAVLAFAAGALITALTFELFEESYEKGGAVRAAVGLGVGLHRVPLLLQELGEQGAQSLVVFVDQH